MTYEEQMDYLAKFHAELDRAAEMEAAIDKGLKQGLEEGRAKGLEQGLKEGRKEGREEGREEKAIEDATKLKAAGISLEIISQCTGVPMDILENL